MYNFTILLFFFLLFRNRYHIDTPRKFDHFTPGVISRELREALGLRSSEIPLHIYQMRILGYPPGWIEHIKEYSSGLEMIDAATSPSSTEGNQTVTYDYDKIIDFPGFNVPVDRRVRDVSGTHFAFIIPCKFFLTLINRRIGAI